MNISNKLQCVPLAVNIPNVFLAYLSWRASTMNERGAMLQLRTSFI